MELVRLVTSVYLPVIALAPSGYGVGNSVVDKLAYFIEHNAKKSVSISCPREKSPLCVSLYKSLVKSFVIPSRLKKKERLERASVDRQDHFSVCLLESSSGHDFQEDLDKCLMQIASENVRSSLLYLVEEAPGQNWSTLREHLVLLGGEMLFFLVTGGANALLWYQVISHGGFVVVDELGFLDNTYVIKEKYDLQGMEICSIAKSWTPYFFFSDCDDSNVCQSNGFLADIATVLERTYNFTLVSNRGLEGWGIFPVEGPFNMSGTWVGVMGDVINGKCSSSLTSWKYNRDRIGLVDFVPLMKIRLLLLLMPQKADFDAELFMRPLTGAVWRVVAGIVLLIGVMLLLPFVLFHSTDKLTWGYKIAVSISWYFFLLMHAYYGGALTMFFATGTEIPFEGIRDVIRAYPDWQLITMAGTDIRYYDQAVQGDPDFTIFYDRIKSDPENTLVTGIAEGLDRVASGRNVFHVVEDRLDAFTLQDPSHLQNIKTFGAEEGHDVGIIFTKNSPVAPVFNLGLQQLRESGVFQQKMHKWFGSKNTIRPPPIEAPVVQVGQMILIFWIMCGALCMSVLVLTAELAWKNWVRSPRRRTCRSER